MSWFIKLRSEHLKSYLRGIKILEEKKTKYYRKYLLAALVYVSLVEAKRTFLQEEWERDSWVPQWVLKARRENYTNMEFYRRKRNKPVTFTFTNWDEDSQMFIHVNEETVDFEKLVLPVHYYGQVSTEEDTQLIAKMAAYYKNKNKKKDLDNYLRHKTVTLGDWLVAVYYYFNIWTKSFDPYFYKPSFLYKNEQDMIELNMQRDNKPEVIVDLLKHFRKKAKKAVNKPQ
mmetsp:Transcript_3106/g.4793  ORF Transcript_3106/g.4793 Transcript_3106/m.4793 type:complete len:229 (+) Transcript_3106:621-1307(+)